MTERPEEFDLDARHYLAKGLVFAGLGGLNCHGSKLFADSSLHRNHGEGNAYFPTNAQWYRSPRLRRWGIRYDGGYSVSTAVPLSSAVIPGAFSLVAWIDEIYTATTAARGMFSWATSFNSGTPRLLVQRNYVDQNLRVYVAGGYRLNIAMPTAPFCLAVTYDGTTWNFYVNGTAQTPYTGAATNTASSLYLGSGYSQAGPIGFSDAFFYDRCLEAYCIEALSDPNDTLYSGLIVPRVTRRVKVPAAPPSGSIAGSSALSVGCGGTLTAKGSLAGSSALTTTANGTLVGDGDLAGVSAIALSASATATGTGSAAGSSALQLAASGTLTAQSALAGSAAITVSASGTLTGTASAGGTTALTATASGTLTGSGDLAGTAAMQLAATGELTEAASGSMVGSAAISLGASGTLRAWGSLAGAVAMALSAVGDLADAAAVVLPAHYHVLEGPSAKLHAITGPSAEAHVLEGPSSKLRILTGSE